MGGDAIQAEDSREARGAKHRNSLAHPRRLSLGGGSLASSRRLRECWSVLDQERDVKEAELWEGWGRKPLEAQPCKGLPATLPRWRCIGFCKRFTERQAPKSGQVLSEQNS